MLSGVIPCGWPSISTDAPLGLVCTSSVPIPSAATGAAIKRSALSVIADVIPINSAAAAASFTRDIGVFAATDCLTCSTGGGAGVSAAACFLSQNPVDAPPGLAGAGGCGAAAGDADACGAGAGGVDNGDA